MAAVTTAGVPQGWYERREALEQRLREQLREARDTAPL